MTKITKALKQVPSAVLVACMFLPLLPTVSVFAADNTYKYCVVVKAANENEAQTKAGKVSATLYFNDFPIRGDLNNCHKKGGSSTAVFTGDYKGTDGGVNVAVTTKEPWAFEKLVLENSCDDPFKIKSVEVFMQSWPGKKSSDSRPVLLYQTLDKWIGKKSGYDASVQVYPTSAWYQRVVKNDKLGNFDNFEVTEYFDAKKTFEDKKVTITWNGKADYDYKPSDASCGDLSKPPTLSATIEGVDKYGNALGSFNVLSNASNQLFSLNDYTFTYNRAKIKKYMDDKGANQLKVKFKLEYSEDSTFDENRNSRIFYRTMSFTRNVFSISSLSFSDNYRSELVDNTDGSSAEEIAARKKDNLYYVDQDNKTITINTSVNTLKSFNHISPKKFTDKTLKFEEAYLTATSKANTTIKLDAINTSTGAKVTEVPITGNQSSISLSFKYDEDMDSNDKGLKLVIKNGYIEDNLPAGIYNNGSKTSAETKVKYYLWDDSSMKYGDNSTDYVYEYTAQKYKLDSAKPSVDIRAVEKNGTAETDLEKWNKYVKINIDASEDIYTTDGESVKAGWASLRLFNGKQQLTIRDYLFNPAKGTSSSSAYYYNHVPATEGKGDVDIYVTPATEVEGECDIRINGYDHAGNYFSESIPVKLDNKPPRVGVKEIPGKKNSGETLSYEYKVDISDNSGTGTMHYVFTENTEAEALALLEDNGEEDKSESAYIESIEDEWCFIEQSDIQSGKTSTVVMSVPDGDIFSGRMFYYAEDEAGNVSDVKSLTVSIDNRNTTCDISPKMGALPNKSYEIYISPQNNANTIEYCWMQNVYNSSTRKNEEKKITEYKKYTIGEKIDTALDAATSSLDGEYYLSVKITPPKSTAATVIKEKYVFDNTAPQISITVPDETAAYSMQGISVAATDGGCGVASGTYRIVNADGSDIEGYTDMPLNVDYDMITQEIPVGGLPSGAYAVKVNAVDMNGTSTEEKSDPFYIRSSAPEGTITATNKSNSTASYNGRALIGKNGQIELNFDITEAFANPSYAPQQNLYYRTSVTAGDYGEWINAGAMTETTTATTVGFAGKLSAALPYIALQETENTIYVQTMICPDGADLSQAEISNVKTNEILVYYDETAPTARLNIDSVHQTKPIEGVLEVWDNMSGELTASCNDTNIEIGNYAADEYNNGSFAITVSKNVDDVITVCDAVGNKTQVNIKVDCIDNEGPKSTIEVDGIPNGGRNDASVTLKISEAVEGSVKVALIPYDDAGSINGKIPKKYYRENLEILTGVKYDESTDVEEDAPESHGSDDTIGTDTESGETGSTDSGNDNFSKFTLVRTNSTGSRWDGEYDLTYKAELKGLDGAYVIGVHATDSLGNESDVVFKDKVITLTDCTPAYVSHTVKPQSAEEKSVVTATFNVPVYVLPQSQISGTEEDNLNRAKGQALSYSDKSSFVISKDDAYKDYDLYIVDEVGRAVHDTLTVSADDVTFDAGSGMKLVADRKYWEYDEETQTNKEYTATDGKFVAAGGGAQLWVYPEAETDDNGNYNLLKPIKEENSGFDFNEDESVGYYTGSGEDKKLVGYKKLVYDISPVYEVDDNGNPIDDEYVDDTERLLNVYAFSSDNADDSDSYAQRMLLITDIDNTAPKIQMTISPEVVTYVEKEDVDESGGDTYKWTDLLFNPTPGDVTFDISVQDKESGIAEIVLVEYESDKGYETVTVPYNTEEYSWDGHDVKTVTGQHYEYDENGGGSSVLDYSNIPVKIVYRGSDDPYGVMRISYTFDDNFRFNERGAFGIFVNGVGVPATAGLLPPEFPLYSEGLIFNMPIEEGKDFKLKYEYQDGLGKWTEISQDELATTYYKKARASIVIFDEDESTRELDRGLYIANNNGSAEKELSPYQNTFTFKLKDKFGYTLDVPVELSNFDVTPGTLEYNLSTYENTNDDITVDITASDSESGVGSVILSNSTTPLVKNGETTSSDGTVKQQYSGVITENGAYSITMYDKAGNKTVKNFNIKNIDKEKPTMTVVYKSADKQWTKPSEAEWTSRPVNAVLSFSKPVKITSVSPSEGSALTQNDYKVNYDSAVITFTDSGSLDVEFEDTYGNKGVTGLVTVSNIDTTPPMVEYYTDPDDESYENPKVSDDGSFVTVTLQKKENVVNKNNVISERNKLRKETEIYVSYGGITKPVVDKDGNRCTYKFSKDGNYSLKVYDDEGLASLFNIEIDGVDINAPKIKSVSWTYTYETYDEASGEWVDTPTGGSIEPQSGTVGYRVAADKHKITNGDVNVTITTDMPTRLSGGDGEYVTSHTKTYSDNGLFMFNAQKKNGRISSYGVDVEIIDKTPPVIDLLEKEELVFYENKTDEYSKSMLVYDADSQEKAFDAYDEFGGKKKSLNTEVQIDWGKGDMKFDPDDIKNNTFNSSKPYTITYTVTDDAHNTTSVKRTVRLVGLTDTIATINDAIPNSSGKCTVYTDSVKVGLKNFSGTAYVRYQKGLKSLGQMKKSGTLIYKNDKGEFEVSGLSEGWYTFYIQTDKRDYFTINVFVAV